MDLESIYSVLTVYYNLESKVDKIIASIFKNKTKPKYYGSLPKGHNGLGLYLLGVSGSDVLSEKVYLQIKNDTLSKVRGTVQADILKEDQAQNTCIFSTHFALKMMADMQSYFIANNIQNFYSAPNAKQIRQISSTFFDGMLQTFAFCS